MDFHFFRVSLISLAMLSLMDESLELLKWQENLRQYAQLQPMRENSAESVSELSHSTLRKADTATSATNTAPISPRCNGAALGGGRGGERSHVEQVRRGMGKVAWITRLLVWVTQPRTSSLGILLYCAEQLEFGISRTLREEKGTSHHIQWKIN